MTFHLAGFWDLSEIACCFSRVLLQYDASFSRRDQATQELMTSNQCAQHMILWDGVDERQIIWQRTAAFPSSDQTSVADTMLLKEYRIPMPLSVEEVCRCTHHFIHVNRTMIMHTRMPSYMGMLWCWHLPQEAAITTTLRSIRAAHYVHSVWFYVPVFSKTLSNDQLAAAVL